LPLKNKAVPLYYRDGVGPTAPHLPYILYIISRVGVHPLRKIIAHEPVFVINIDITKIRIIILMAQQISAQIWRNFNLFIHWPLFGTGYKANSPNLILRPHSDSRASAMV